MGFIERMLRGEVPDFSIEKRYIHKQGHEVWVELFGSLILKADGSPDYMIGILMDISDRKRIDLELNNALRAQHKLAEMRSQFISTVSHEFRTPMTIVQMSAEAIESRDLSPDKLQERCRRIKKAIADMTKLTDNILLFNQFEVGKMLCQLELIDLQSFCEDLVNDIQFAWDQQRIFLQTTGVICEVWLDKRLLNHILTNLLSNAAKYSSQSDRIDFELVCTDSTIILRIADRGIGISSDEQSRIFESYHRASNVGRIKGTGIGLAIVKQSVEALGGCIAVESTLGVGTTFTVTIPIVAPPHDEL
jgi:signal transduction histidine kinase